MTRISVGLAGSSERALLCAQVLSKNDNFDLLWLITPCAKPVGRERKITPNPVQTWAESVGLSTLLVDGGLDLNLQTKLQSIQPKQPDFLLVVDFGYLVPVWLLTWPKLLPLNIHPSALPRWRGSSPGQFALLFADRKSAVSLIIMDKQFDSGQILAQIPFSIKTDWTQTEYYQTAFRLIADQLPELLIGVFAGKIKGKPQFRGPSAPLARKLLKNDAFIPWTIVEAAMTKTPPSAQKLVELKRDLTPLLRVAFDHQPDTNHPLAELVERAIRAFQPWPQVWTFLPAAKKKVRAKLLKAKLGKEGELILEKIQRDGQMPKNWQPE